VRRCFTAPKHQNALRDPQIPPDAETQVQSNMSRRAFCGNRTRPTQSRKIVPRCFTPGRTRMHYVTRRSHQFPKHKSSVTHPVTLFMETTSGPPEEEKYYIDVSHPKRTGMHYMSHRSHRMQKPRFNVRCHDALFVQSVSVPPDHKK
jgi:hypothetical protein